jgi:hypothetical protein
VLVLAQRVLQQEGHRRLHLHVEYPGRQAW